MSEQPIIGVSVGTPMSPEKIKEDLKPVKTVNGKAPDENGNVEVDIYQGEYMVGEVTTYLGEHQEVK